MPFRSESQRKKCWVTNGFNGAINCAQWQKETKSKSLAKKVPKSAAKKKSK